MKKMPVEANCPYCGLAMVLGEARVHSTALGMLVAGFSNQHLSFFGKGRKKVRVLSSGNRIKAHHCEGCGTTVVPNSNTEYRWLD